MLACGKRSLAVVCSDSTARACGDNVQGQLGMGSAREIRTLSVLEMCVDGSKSEDKVPDVKTLMIATSDSFLASVDTKGQVWISGMFAEVVDKAARYKMQILDMQFPARIVFVATGHMHCLALSEDKHVFAAGKNWSGQLGMGDANVKYLKQLSRIAAGPWDGQTSMITCGACYSAILTDDGAVRTFGQYTSKCLGIVRNSTAHLVGYTCPNVFMPTLIDACNPALTLGFELPAVEFVTAGVQHVVAIANGVLYTWGQNCCGQLGTGCDFGDRIFPTRVGGEDVFGSKVRLAAANQHHTLVLTENRDLWAFGNCEQGRLGLDKHEHFKFVMGPQMLNMQYFDYRRIACIAAGKGHSAVLTEDGNLYTWGQGRLNEWKSVVPSALGYAQATNFQPVPRLVQQRYKNIKISYAKLQAIYTDAKIFRTHCTRSSGEQIMYGVYSKLPLEHAIAFLMGTHKRLGSQGFITGCSSKKNNIYLALFSYDSSLLQMILQQTSCNSMLCKTYAKFPALRKIMGDASV